MRIAISGYPLPEPVIIYDITPDGLIHPDGWLLDHADVAQLLRTWRDAPTDEDDVTREWAYSESGLFVTALYMEGEIGIAFWESARGSDGTDVYSTQNMPFDFDIRLLDDTTGQGERFRTTGGTR
ncbi:MAG TPA: hypothetical protein PK781_01555 [Terrimesophilobacter sp.]|nr:hypothetical protein [Terrimesophilobacter sp.]HRP99127.1 hypothetical protein [Terrimesophilobacter sp.]